MTWQLDDKNHQQYLAACRRGIENFRADDTVKMIIENSGLQSGREYYELIHEVMPELMEYAERFTTSDAIGNPETHYIGKQQWSPTTLRYIKTVMDLVLHFGSLDGLRILEIGGGYGGLQKIVHDLFAPEIYVTMDIPEAEEIQMQFLSKSVPMLSLIKKEKFDMGFDIVISCSAWSELSRDVQWLYFHEQIQRSIHGYFQLNYDIDFSLNLLKQHWPNLIEEDMFYGVLPSQAYEPYNKIVIC